jgi:monooxygenase
VSPSATPAEHLDVLVVGAGISGICAGHHLQEKCPGKSFAILESRDSIGGTWDLFRYPGIRSDSDMYTLGFRFKPWSSEVSIADGPSIMEYLRETVDEENLEDRIRFGHRVVNASWSSEESRWTVTAEVKPSGETVRLTCSFLLFCTGYYRYDRGYTPEFAGTDRFHGPVIHPQFWPEDLDYSGKRVVVIGSGATAVTLVPAMAKDAAHVTMLQRSPTYVVSLPGRDPLARALRRLRLPERLVYPIVRWKNLLMTMASFQLARRRPRVAKALLRKGAERHLPAGFPTDPHFRPKYNPWEQRLCLVPNANLFRVLGTDRASIVTDTIETFTENGIRLGSGEELEADVIVTATGLDLVPLGDAAIEVDGEQVDVGERLTYKGSMLDRVPNAAATFGYTNASWTLKCELTIEYICRVLTHMDAHGFDVVTPRNTDDSVEPEPIIDFNSGYVIRSLHLFPNQGSRRPWRLHQNYALDIRELRRAPIEDEDLEFSRAPATAEAPVASAA